jgi:hypothetical protein
MEMDESWKNEAAEELSLTKLHIRYENILGM